MMLPGIPRLRRAIVVYIGTIVVPACAFLWLGIQSFDRQRQALETLRADSLTRETELRVRAEAAVAFDEPDHPIVRHRFEMRNGVLTRPALHGPVPAPLPLSFLEADSIEADRPELALESYRELLARGEKKSLALARIARILTRLGREQEARATWRRLAAEFPDERDLAHRPYGIVGALEAGDSGDLYDAITSGRWELSADQAEYFLIRLDAERNPYDTAYMDRFRFAADLNARFRPSLGLRENDVQVFTLGNQRIFYRADGENTIAGFSVDENWVEHTLVPAIAAELGVDATVRQDAVVYGGAIALVFLILSSGVWLLWRDVSREAHTNRLRTEFVSGVTHELKTPITLIRLYGETLLRHAGLDSEERADFQRIIVRESTRLGRLVDEVLTVSRIERGEQTYAFEQGDLAALVAETVEDYRGYAERSGFHLHCNLPDTAVNVQLDAVTVSQALVNLLDNAVKYSGSSRDIRVRLKSEHGESVVEVEDRGLGIPSSELDRIFDRFYRVGNSYDKGGYGLGLYLVRHTMEAHGGRVEVESEPGSGSIFRLVFPRAGS
jgi:signal transduction histidine kinase